MYPRSLSRTVGRILLVAALLFGGSGLAGTALGHEATCNTGPVSTYIHLPSAVSDHGSVTEYVQFTLLHRTTAEGVAFDTRNNVDAYIHDLGCHSSGSLLFDLDGNDPENLNALEVHFYDHQGFETGDTPCQKSAFDDETVPDTTQYVVVVACQGAPLGVTEETVPLPSTVEINLDVY